MWRIAFRYIQTGRLWPGSSVSHVAHRDPSSADGGAQSARDDAAFDGNKAAQALAVAQRAEKQAQDIALMVSKAQSANHDRLDGLDAAISGLRADVDRRVSSIQSNAQSFSDSVGNQLSKFRAEAGVLDHAVSQVPALADAVKTEVSEARLPPRVFKTKSAFLKPKALSLKTCAWHWAGRDSEINQRKHQQNAWHIEHPQLRC
jgi:hypothetical protein